MLRRFHTRAEGSSTRAVPALGAVCCPKGAAHCPEGQDSAPSPEGSVLPRRGRTLPWISVTCKGSVHWSSTLCQSSCAVPRGHCPGASAPGTPKFLAQKIF